MCIAEQSYLAVINSQKEADYLVKLTADAPKNYKGPYLAGAVLLGFHNHFGEGYTTVHGKANIGNWFGFKYGHKFNWSQSQNDTYSHVKYSLGPILILNIM